MNSDFDVFVLVCLSARKLHTKYLDKFKKYPNA